MKAKDFRSKAWNDLNGLWGTFALTYFLASLALSAAGFTVAGAIIISGPVTLGLTAMAIKTVRKQKVQPENVLDGFKNFVPALVLNVVNSIFIFLWTLLFIVPGIVKKYSYSMSFYILNDHPEMSQADARKKSIELMNGNKWRLFCLDFSFIGWYILTILTIGILSFWVDPYVELAHAEFYKDLIKEEDAKASSFTEIPQEKIQVFDEEK